MDRVERLKKDVLASADAEKINVAIDNIVKHPYADYLCLYGAGNTARITIAAFERQNIKIDFLCESSGGGSIGKTFYGYRVISYDDLLLVKDRTLVIPAYGDPRGCYEKLKSNGFPYVIYCNELMIDNIETLRQLDKCKLCENITELQDMCTDGKSFETALIVLKSMLKLEISFDEIQTVYTSGQYILPGLFEPCAGDNIVDCGAYTGDTVESFVKYLPDYGKIYAIEMDEANYNTLLQNTKEYRDVRCYNAGVSDREGISYYSREGTSSTFTQSGSQMARLTTLDSLLYGERIDFIKMDIEGAEVVALRGAEGIIRDQKPKCAICVYHNPTQMLEVPILLRQFVPDYKIYIRHHLNNMFYETVCYTTL